MPSNFRPNRQAYCRRVEICGTRHRHRRTCAHAWRLWLRQRVNNAGTVVASDQTYARPDEVDQAYRDCLSAGGKIQSQPEYHYTEDDEDYYAFFAFDPDGIRIEVFSWLGSPYRSA
jgi:hypothetical protein